MANWVGLTAFRAGTPVWVNLDAAAIIRQGAAAFAEATLIVIPGQPDLYVQDNVRDVAAAAGATDVSPRG